MNFPRYYVPGAIVFITQVVNGRLPVFANASIYCAVLREAQKRYPFAMLAYVFLPDHFHLLIRPEGNHTHSQIMRSVKPNFTKIYKNRLGIAGTLHLWQKRYWDHVIRDETNFARHLDYIHYNPVRHGIATRP